MTIPSTNPLTTNSTTSTGSNTTGTAGIAGSAPNSQMFLQLLVAQIKNQDPTNPADGTQFVAQLAQFSQLEQTIAMRQDLDQMAKLAVTPAVTPAQE
jgi:flagellar basal-body rod modification protein FlgD